MQQHPTVQTTPSTPVTALVLVGPPASGKTTLRTLCEDFGACGLDLEQFHTHGCVNDDGYEAAIEQLVHETEQTDLGVCCIEGAVSTAEIDTVRQYTSSVLVVRVTVADDIERVDRYVDRELESEPGDLLHETEERAVRDYAHAREIVETPYPDHDVTITNADGVSTSELLNRVAHLLDALSMQETPVLISPRKSESETVDTTDRPEYLQTMGSAMTDTAQGATEPQQSIEDIVEDVSVLAGERDDG